MLVQVAAQDIGQVTYIESGAHRILSLESKPSGPGTPAHSPGVTRPPGRSRYVVNPRWIRRAGTAVLRDHALSADVSWMDAELGAR